MSLSGFDTKWNKAYNWLSNKSFVNQHMECSTDINHALEL